MNERPAPAGETPRRNVPVVAIAASAGSSVASCERLLPALPRGVGLAYVLALETDEPAAALADRFAPLTELKLLVADDGMQLEPEHVYVLPHARRPTLRDGVLRLASLTASGDPKRLCDELFRALADDLGERAIGVVLSGSGTDGAEGLVAIRAGGGLTLVEDPADAVHGEMPRNAIAGGGADLVLPLDSLGPAIEAFAAHPYMLEGEPENATEAERAHEGFDVSEVVALLRQDANFDPSAYRPNTVRRRIQRRMGVHHVLGLDDYLTILRKDPEELGSLLRDLLISVTDFFRDPRAFAFLEDRVVPELVERAADQRLRVWVPACATGEEAYSLGICLLEALSDKGSDATLQVFATDVDEAALQVARRGIYAASRLAELPAARRDRFFTPLGENQYRVVRELRDCVTFAEHDALRDAPFTNLDLVSCRNLMIYLKRDSQAELMNVFHFAIRRDGFLFLGSSERPLLDEQSFEVISKEHRIFRRVGRSRRPAPRDATTSGGVRTPRPPARPAPREPGMIELACRAVLDSIETAAVVVDRSGRVLFLHGAVGDYLELPQGELDLNLFSLLREEFRARVRAGVSRCQRLGETVTFPEMPSGPNAHAQGVQIRITPARAGGSAGLLTICFEPMRAPGSPTLPTPVDSAEASLVQLLEQELDATRTDLRATLDELEISNDELRSSHEESLAMNEELQSTNEEIEASAEELRLLNEELTVVNRRLRDNLRALEVAHDDLANFFASTKLATAFLDAELRVQRFTPEIERLLGLRDRDVDRPFFEFLRHLDPDFLSAARAVLAGQLPEEAEVCTEDGSWYRRSILPYRTDEKSIAGLVVTFTDVTDLKLALKENVSRALQQAASARLGIDALQRSKDLESLIREIPRVAAETLGMEFAKVLQLEPDGEHLLLRAGHGWQPGQIGETHLSVARGSQAGYSLTVNEPVVVTDLRDEPRFETPLLLAEHGVRSGISCVIHGADGPWGVLGVHSCSPRVFSERDVSFVQGTANILGTAVQRNEAEQALRASEERLRSAKEAAEIGIHDFDPVRQVILWDARTRELWGVPLDEEPITYDTFLAGLHPDDAEAVNAGIEAALDPNGDGYFAQEYRVIARGSTQARWILATGDVTFEGGRAVRLVGTVLDITARKELEEALREHAQRLEEEDRRKELFLATLGHELRNPLAALDSATMAIERGTVRPEEVQPMMAGHVRQLTSLVNDLLEVSRINQGKLAVSLAPTSLARIVQSASEAVRSSAEAREQSLQIEIRDDCWVNGDATRLEQIVANLLGNASKYTPQHGHIDVVLERRGTDAVLTVRDDGRGLRHDQLEMIFEPFVQEEPGVGGLGIGLSLVRGLVGLHGGTVRAESAGPGHGSTFSVSLPGIEANDAARERKPQVAEVLPKATRLLVVDDARDTADMLALLLRSTGAQVTCAYTGAQAVEEAKRSRPHVALVDIGLPDILGYEVAKRLRESEETRDTLLIALTGFGDSTAAKLAREAGFYTRLVKPVPFSELAGLIARHVQRLGVTDD